jgi:hypothetical protein
MFRTMLDGIRNTENDEWRVAQIILSEARGHWGDGFEWLVGTALKYCHHERGWPFARRVEIEIRARSTRGLGVIR